MIEVFTDGRAEPNPGVGTFGYVVYEGGRRVHSSHGLAGEGVTNNYAEYYCLVKALQYLSPRRDEEIKVFSDSALLVNQMKGAWRFKGGPYGAKYREAKELAVRFTRLAFEWVPRERNSEADELTNIAFAEARSMARREPKG
ncbi:MAG: ribonuclease HI family protein [Nitrososphaerota archaeon]|nr:ribonuclease HI family protein [Nitrososphaerota archaeon]